MRYRPRQRRRGDTDPEDARRGNASEQDSPAAHETLHFELRWPGI
jgi:hypothetical protein